MSKEKLLFKFASEKDLDLYFKWANDPAVRHNSYNSDPVVYENHVKWFRARINDPDYYFYLFYNETNEPVGQVRIVKGNETIIGISVDEKFRGRSLSAEMLRMSGDDFLKKNSGTTITAYIKKENMSSYSAFKKAGFEKEEIVTEQGCESFKLQRKYKINE
jgi:RimJ/RimL family protein N-acetyltransferase